MRKTKIVCTLGLVSGTAEIIGKMMDAGMNVARFNFSHGTHDSHKAMLDVVVAEREKRNLPVAALLDTKGPEIRLGLFKNGKETLVAGDDFVLHSEVIEGTQKEANVSFPELYKDVKAGDVILLDDGLIELNINKIEDKKIYCTIVNGGDISNRKGVNIPGATISLPYISEQDRADILFGIKAGFDFVAASFVRNAADVLELRTLLNENGGKHIQIISKIENADGVNNSDEILALSDGIMVARGDMGVEIAFEHLPALQKMLIEKAYTSGKTVITATQMLESMIKNPRPTRAEVSDVANAVYDGTSAIMLSGESAAGKYPVRAVETMARIAETTEQNINYQKRFNNSQSKLTKSDITNAISHAICATAYELDAKAIVAFSISGRSARNISKYRPDKPIIGCTTSEIAYRQMGMAWGVVPVMITMVDDVNELFDQSVGITKKLGFVEDGDIAVIATGMPLRKAGTTNMIKVHIAGEPLVMGISVNDLRATGKVCVAKTAKEALEKFEPGDALVLKDTTDELAEIMIQASAIICEGDEFTSHAARAALTVKIPMMLAVKDATTVLKHGGTVSVDAQRGAVYKAVSKK